MTSGFSRRRMLRGMLGGSAVGVGIPLLNAFLNSNGTALAATVAGKAGAPLPVRFGTWFWGCGMTPARWTPSKTGANYDLPIELKALAPVQKDVSILSGFNVILDGKANHVHISGTYGTRTGAAPASPTNIDLPTFDTAIADVIGNGTRFRSLELTATGDPKHTFSRRSAAAVNPSERSPLAFYQRVFGAEFQDPNAADFKPDPRIMLRKSVLSVVKDDRKALETSLGAEDRERLDEYFTSVRQLENQLELQLQKPPPAEACAIPAKVGELPVGTEIEQALSNHKLMTQMLAMALACNQTRVFNMVLSEQTSTLHKKGESTGHHTLTHEEPVDRTLGYQPKATWFVEQSMDAWVTFVSILASIKEGDGTLLDNCLVYAHSDTSLAKLHDILGLPGMLAGKAGGKVKSGIHVAGNGDAVTRIGFTLQQIMGVPLDKWGTGSMQTGKTISELLV